MSFHNTSEFHWRLVLKPEARRDVSDILLYTRRRWGVKQRGIYRQQLHRAMMDLAGYPEMGRPREDLFEGCRSLPVGEHLLFYRVTETEVIISRVLHRRQDAAEHVSP